MTIAVDAIKTVEDVVIAEFALDNKNKKNNV